MSADQLVSLHRGAAVGRIWAFWAALLALASPASAADRALGEWIVVSSPITSQTVSRVRNEADRAIQSRQARKIVFHFQGGEPSPFGTCSDLADYLLTGIKGQAETYAYVDKPLKGHATLAALACRTLYMGRDGSIGFDEETYQRHKPFDPPKVEKYVHVAEQRGRPVALVLKMLDPGLVVKQVELQGKSYKLEEAQAGKYKISPRYFLTPEERNTQPRDFLGAGRFGYYTAAEAVATGLARREYSSPEQVASALGLPGSVVQGNPLLSLDQPPRAGWIEVSGEIDRGAAETVKRKIDTALSRHKVDCLIFHINAFGGPGSVEPADSLARYIEDQAREKNVLTVAFISGAARGAATFVAFGCRQIVMGPNADLGDCEMLVRERGRPFPEEDVKPARDRLIKLAEDHGYPPVLARGLMDPSLEIVQVQEIPDPNQPAEAGGTLFMTRADAEERKDRFTIVPGQPVKRAGSLLKFNTDQAVAWGIARHRVESAEKESVIALYGVEPSNLVPLRADWLDSLVNVLTHPVATVFLVIVGFTCLILEFKAPGVGFPAITAALCFILLFWAHSWLAREVNSLAILLFLLGLVLLGVEIFLLPGFGIAGISGIVLILLSLALVVVQRWPQSEAEYAELGKNVGLFAGGLCVAAAAAYILARQLPSIPVANRLVLPPPEETSDAGATLSPATAPALLGAIGIAVTTLRPTGKARFGDEFVDVVAEGHYLEAGARVQVIEIDGLRVVVKPV